jgi:hypothetical protein
MAAPIFQRTIVDSDGNVEVGASVTVRNEANNELAAIYVDRELTEVKANPFVTDETGLAQFFVARGEYKITATSGDSEIEWRFVQMLDTAFLASTDTAQTLTNKTISVDDNTVSGVAASSFVLSNASGNIDGAASQKAIPAGFVVGTSDTQELSNKTISGASNTLSNIGNSSLTNSSLTIGTTTIALGATGNLSASDIPNLDASKITTGTISADRLPSYVDDVLEFANLASFPDPGETGKIYIALDTNKVYRWSGSVYVYITSGAVDSVAGKTGIVTLDKNDVGLNNVDNTADSAKNVATAATLTTARTIGGVSFDGSANINLPGVNIAGNQDTSGNAATATNVAYSGLTGTVPTWNQDTTGNAATATALQTARTIGGVSFDGTANINLPGVNIAGNQDTTGNAATATNVAYSGLTGVVPTWNQDTTGNAATATALATARTIGGVSFDGTANIDLPGVNTAGNQNTTGTAANVTGTVAVENGGTGATTLTANNLVVGSGTSAVGFIAPGTAGNVLTSNGTIWESVPAAASGGGVTVAASAPAGPSNGDLWFDTTNNTLKIWITSTWRGVGSYT